MSRLEIAIKRAYERPDTKDGWRILVDRVWPRGVSKGDMRLDKWMKELAPSTALRNWFGHDPERWSGFRKRYNRELDDQPELVEELLALCREGRVTLIFGAKDREHNQAAALKDYLETAARR